MRYHYLFEGRHADRIWQLAMTRAHGLVADALARTVAEHVAAIGGPKRDLDWPQPHPNLHVAFGEAIVDYYGMVRYVAPTPLGLPRGRDGMRAVEGPAPPDGFLLQRTPDYVTWRYYRDGEFSFAIESDSP